ncbi:hypothetical protein FJNA_08080 [Thermus sp. FJN-A]
MALLLSLVLRGGVLLAALLVFLGGLGVLAAHWDVPAQELLRTPLGSAGWAPIPLVRQLIRGHLETLVPLGLWVLILTPVARVALSALLFGLEGDRFYMGVSLWVLLVLVLSLLGVL